MGHAKHGRGGRVNREQKALKLIAGELPPGFQGTELAVESKPGVEGNVTRGTLPGQIAVSLAGGSAEVGPLTPEVGTESPIVVKEDPNTGLHSFDGSGFSFYGSSTAALGLARNIDRLPSPQQRA